MPVHPRLLPSMLGLALTTASSIAIAAPTTKPSTVPAVGPRDIRLFPGDAPGVVADAGHETDDGHGRRGNVTVPTITPYLPERDKATGAAIIVCPGGGYGRVGVGPKGEPAVAHFVPRGVAVVVLKYRTRPPSKQVEADALADAKRAVRLVRHHAAGWGIDPRRVGVLGWSAGSHLILNLASHADDGDPTAADPVERESCRPDFVAAMCPWPSRSKPADFPVPPDAPPLFMCAARDDKTAPTAFARAVRDAYVAAGASVTLVEVERGGHEAFTIDGAGEGGKWTDEFWPWLREIKAVPAE